MTKNLLDMFDDLDRQTDPEGSGDDRIIRAPFGYPGGKTKSISNILTHITQRACQ